VRVGRQIVGAKFPGYLSEARQSGRRHGGEAIWLARPASGSFTSD
jgi:hypothetical protein